MLNARTLLRGKKINSAHKTYFFFISSFSSYFLFSFFFSFLFLFSYFFLFFFFFLFYFFFFFFFFFLQIKQVNEHLEMIRKRSRSSDNLNKESYHNIELPLTPFIVDSEELRECHRRC